MTGHTFRNPELFQVLPFREWMRKNLPSGSQGMVIEDLDLVIRVYGTNFGSDAVGKFMLIELKFKKSWIGQAQKRTFGQIDRLLRKADPDAKRYMGYFVVQYDDEDWDKAQFKVNRKRLPTETFKRFLLFDSAVIATLSTVL